MSQRSVPGPDAPLPAVGAGPVLPGGLQRLLRDHAVWRGEDFRARACPDEAILPTGFPLLDEQLPGGGWRPGMLVEILLPYPGIGETRLLLPALSALSRRGRWLAWVAPPWIPYAPALLAAGVDLQYLLVVRPASDQDALWAAEQALRDAGGVLCCCGRGASRGVP